YAGVGRTLPRNEEYGGGETRCALTNRPRRHLRVERPRFRDSETPRPQSIDQRRPTERSLVGIDANQWTVRLAYAIGLRKVSRHHVFVEGSCSGLVSVMATDGHHGFTPLGCQIAPEVIRVGLAQAALEPNVEEIREIRVRNVVVVGRISDYC